MKDIILTAGSGIRQSGMQTQTVTMTVSSTFLRQCYVLMKHTEILRVIWARGKACAERWTEEVALLLEEMRRTLAYCEFKARWWRECKDLRSGEDSLVLRAPKRIQIVTRFAQ